MPAPATFYTISPSVDSTIAIEVSKTGLRRRKKHTLFFDKFRGEMCFAPDDPGAFTMTLAIDATDVTCRDAWLREKKRNAVAEFARKNAVADSHPEICFTSKSIRAKALRGFVVEGILRIRGITRVAKMDLVLNPRRKDCLQIDGDGTLRLSDFDLPRPSALFGLIGTKDEAAIRFLLWAIPPEESSQY